MSKPWSIATAVRSPDRLRGFLAVLREFDNQGWGDANQCNYHIKLIQARLYGYGNPQFYKKLSRAQIDLIENTSLPISFKKAQEIFDAKNYEDPPMRGRQSVNPLKKMGFVVIENDNVKVTELGNLLLAEDSDLGEIFFRSFLKWQLPNPDSRDFRSGAYNIKPFVGTLHLINAVNQMEIARGNKAKGINKDEFCFFCLTLINHQNVGRYAEEIIALRDAQAGKSLRERNEIVKSNQCRLAGEFLCINDEQKLNKLLKNLRDYGDNVIRYFRLTRYLYIRGGGFYVDLEPRRKVEIDSLLAQDNAAAHPFESTDAYRAFLVDINQPQLPWDNKANYIAIVDGIVQEINNYQSALGGEGIETPDCQSMSNDELKNCIAQLRQQRKDLQDAEIRIKSQQVETVTDCMATLTAIFERENRPTLLEQLSALGLHALNDAECIQPNYPVGDDNKPTFTAPAGVPDIECFYDSFIAICEVTMLTTRAQWYNEGQPVMRHLRDFENKHDKVAYCLFIAPSLHRDTVNTFWTAVKYEYEGRKQKIIPLTIQQFVSILQVWVDLKRAGYSLSHGEILSLYDAIVDLSNSRESSDDWRNDISNEINDWRESLIARI